MNPPLLHPQNKHVQSCEVPFAHWFGLTSINLVRLSTVYANEFYVSQRCCPLQGFLKQPAIVRILLLSFLTLISRMMMNVRTIGVWPWGVRTMSLYQL